jgi:hypothetical protein
MTDPKTPAQITETERGDDMKTEEKIACEVAKEPFLSVVLFLALVGGLVSICCGIPALAIRFVLVGF